ncbi:MAG: hypothetical protein AB7H70_01365 [Rhodospirillaceae bacterium]
MHQAYRVCFFEDGVLHATAVLVLHFASDNSAEDEAVQLLAASALSRVEVWRGTRRICERHRLSTRAALAVHAPRV